MANTYTNNIEYVSMRVREILENTKYERSVHVEINWESGEAPVIEYYIEEYAVGKVE